MKLSGAKDDDHLSNDEWRKNQRRKDSSPQGILIVPFVGYSRKKRAHKGTLGLLFYTKREMARGLSSSPLKGSLVHCQDFAPDHSYFYGSNGFLSAKKFFWVLQYLKLPRKQNLGANWSDEIAVT